MDNHRGRPGEDLALSHEIVFWHRRRMDHSPSLAPRGGAGTRRLPVVVLTFLKGGMFKRSLTARDPHMPEFEAW